jgi:hypothetical protein
MLPVRINQEEWDGRVVWHVEWTGVYRVWVRKPEVKDHWKTYAYIRE